MGGFFIFPIIALLAYVALFADKNPEASDITDEEIDFSDIADKEFYEDNESHETTDAAIARYDTFIRASSEAEDTTLRYSNIDTNKVLGKTYFTSGNHTLTESGKDFLDKIANTLMSDTSIKATIIGSADAKGKDINNMMLSTNRAYSAYHYLTDEKGVDPRQIESIVSRGESDSSTENNPTDRSIIIETR